MARLKLQPERAVVERCRAMQDDLRSALARLPARGHDPGMIDAVWHGEALGTLLWALQLAELPPYDEPFVPDEVVAADLAGGELREPEDVDDERESARLWHWRARTADVQRNGTALPDRYASFDQLIASVAMRGYEQGLLPQPVRGDFAAYGGDYRRLSREQLAEAHAVAAERHHALTWLTAPGTSWEDVTLDT
jgi:hypothetical protein